MSMRNKIGIRFASALLLIAGTLFMAVGCSQTSPTSSVTRQQKYLPFNISPDSSDAYGEFVTESGATQYVNIINGDTVIQTNSSSITSDSHVYFFGSGDTPQGMSLNGQSYASWTAPDNSVQYELDSCAFHTDGTNNIFTYQIGSNTYTDTVNAAIGDIAVSAPSFAQSVSKSSALNVAWTASSYAGDYVQITLSDKFSVPPDTTKISNGGTFNDSLGYYSTNVDDNGSFSIPASVLSGFTAPMATLTIARGTFNEVTHGGKNYMFVFYTYKTIDVFLH